MSIAVVLAGGKSARMGHDKATMYGGVERLQQCLEEAGFQRVIVLCGSAERKKAFAGEVMADPPNIDGLHRLIPWVRNKLQADILLVPCDAFLLTKEAVQRLLEQAEHGGVPLDGDGIRQPLFAYLPQATRLDESANSVTGLMKAVPSVELNEYAACFTNFNTQNDLSRLEREHPPR